MFFAVIVTLIGVFLSLVGGVGLHLAYHTRADTFEEAEHYRKLGYKSFFQLLLGVPLFLGGLFAIVNKAFF